MCTQVPGNKLHGLDLVLTLAQARNMSIGEHRHCCVTFEI